MRALRANVKPAHCKFKGRTFSSQLFAASNSANACFLSTTELTTLALGRCSRLLNRFPYGHETTTTLCVFCGESYAIQRPCCPPVNECRVRSTVIIHTARHAAFWPQPVGSLPLAQNAWHCTRYLLVIIAVRSTLRMRALRANVKPAHCKFKGRTFSFRNSANACFLATTDHPCTSTVSTPAEPLSVWTSPHETTTRYAFLR